jgi:hypothetical protein
VNVQGVQLGRETLNDLEGRLKRRTSTGQLGRETLNDLDGRLKVRRTTSTGRRTSDSNGMI